MKPPKVPLELLNEWLRIRLGSESLDWLEEKAVLLATGAPERLIFLAFSSVIRFTGKAPLDLTPAESAEAHGAAPGWNPSDWTLDQAARTWLLLSLPTDFKTAKIIHQIYLTADVGEAVALQKALAVLAKPENHIAWARDGIRSNIQEVFEAIALRNPYPSHHFDDIGWNQLVTKVLFLGLPLHAIYGIEDRINSALSKMLVDLVYERRTAGREFNPELWRCVGKYADSRALDALETSLQRASPIEKRAAALALHSCPDSRAADILKKSPSLALDIAQGKWTWETFADDT